MPSDIQRAFPAPACPGDHCLPSSFTYCQGTSTFTKEVDLIFQKKNLQIQKRVEMKRHLLLMPFIKYLWGAMAFLGILSTVFRDLFLFLLFWMTNKDVRS